MYCVQGHSVTTCVLKRLSRVNSVCLEIESYLNRDYFWYPKVSDRYEGEVAINSQPFALRILDIAARAFPCGDLSTAPRIFLRWNANEILHPLRISAVFPNLDIVVLDVRTFLCGNLSVFPNLRACHVTLESSHYSSNLVLE